MENNNTPWYKLPADQQNKYLEARQVVIHYADLFVRIEEKFGKKFQKLFGRPITDFKSVIGFDLIAFDKFIAPDDGISTAKYTEEKYGKKALALINSIIEFERTPAK